MGGISPCPGTAAETFADQAAKVNSGNRTQRLDAVIGYRGVDRVSSSAAHADRADAVVIHLGQRDQIIDGETDIGDSNRWIFDKARRTSTRTRETNVECKGDKALFGKRRAIDIARGLFFATDDWVRAYYSWVFLRLIEVCWQVDVTGRVPTRPLSGQTSRRVRTSNPAMLLWPIDRCWMHSLRWRASASRVFASGNRNSNGGWNRNPNRGRADPRQQPLPVDLHGFTEEIYVTLGRPGRLARGWIR